MGVATIGGRPRWAPLTNARIDSSHPLSQGLTFLWARHARGGHAVPAPASSVTLADARSDFGPAVAGNGANSVIRYSPPSTGATTTSPFTVMAIGGATATTGTERMARLSASSGVTSVAGMDARESGATAFVRFFVISSTGVTKTWNGPASDIKRGHVGIMTYPGSGSTPFATWDGAYYALGSTTDVRAYTEIEVMASNAAGDVAVSAVAVWDRALSLAEHAALNADPFQFLVW